MENHRPYNKNAKMTIFYFLKTFYHKFSFKIIKTSGIQFLLNKNKNRVRFLFTFPHAEYDLSLLFFFFFLWLSPLKMKEEFIAESTTNNSTLFGENVTPFKPRLLFTWFLHSSASAGMSFKQPDAHAGLVVAGAGTEQNTIYSWFERCLTRLLGKPNKA
jgi:hypothetical protein